MMKIHETELRNIAPALCLILVAGLCFSASHATAAIIDKAQPDTALVYKTVGGAELKLHVFVPAQHKATDSAPAIVFFFGGGWNGGTPEQFYEQSRYLAEKGIVCISADYRVKKRHGTGPFKCCLLYTSPSPRDGLLSRMPSSA